jgi:predicted DNA binding protein
MRRLVIELRPEQLEARGQSVPGPGAQILEKVKSLEMLHILRMVPGEFAAIARIELRDPKFNVDDVFALEGLPSSKIEKELLDQESDVVSTYFLRIKTSARPKPAIVQQAGLMPFVSTPLEFSEGKVRVTFLGNSSQIRRYLRVLSKQSRIKFKVASLTDARFPPNSPIGKLTEKQRRVLITAYKLGYYDVPRKITSAELARRLNLVKSTFSAHVRKAERRLLRDLLSEV